MLRSKSIFIFSALALPASLAGAPVDGAEVRAAAAEFVCSRAGRAVLPGRETMDPAARGNLWIVPLSPSGHVIVSGSDLTEPVLLFSENDFSEPAPSTPMREALDATSANVAAAEARGGARHRGWIRGEASPANPEAPCADSAPLAAIPEIVKARYDQWQPQNDFSPVVAATSPESAYRARNPAGCVAVANVQIYKTLRWPARIDRTRTVSHALQNFPEDSSFSIRINGMTPIDWDALLDGRWSARHGGSYPTWNDDAGSSDLRGFFGEAERYRIARAIAWESGNAGMAYQGGQGVSAPQTSNNNVLEWFLKGRDVHPTNDVENLIWKGLSAGIPQITSIGGHAVVADGYQPPDGDTPARVHLNYGWSGDWNQWASVETGPVKYIVAGEWPRAKAQLDPLPNVSEADVALSWHFPDVWKNRVSDWKVGVWKGRGEIADHAVSFADGDSAKPSLGNGIFPLGGVWRLSQASKLFFNLSAIGDNSGLSVEARFGNGPWEEVFSFIFPWNTSETVSYPQEIPLSSRRGETASFRVKKWSRGYDGSVAIGDVELAGAVAYEKADSGFSVDVDSSGASASVSGLAAGADYAFSVAPVLDGECPVDAEESDFQTTTIEGVCRRPAASVAYSLDGGVGEWETSGEPSESSPVNVVAIFSGSLLPTEDSELSYVVTGNPDHSYELMWITFTPEGGDAENVSSEYILQRDSNVKKTASLAKFAGRAGRLTLAHYCYGDTAAEVSDITVTNVGGISGALVDEAVEALGFPSIDSVTVTKNGATENLVDGVMAEGPAGSLLLNVSCSASTATLEAFPSHLTVLPDKNVHVETLGGGDFAVSFDPVVPAKWNRTRMALTLVATDVNGTKSYRDVVLRLETDPETEKHDGSRLAKPIAVWNRDFADGSRRGGVEFHLKAKDQETSSDAISGGAIVKAAVSSEDNGWRANCLYLDEPAERLVVVAGVKVERDTTGSHREMSVVGARRDGTMTPQTVAVGFDESGTLEAFAANKTAAAGSATVPAGVLTCIAMDAGSGSLKGYVDGAAGLSTQAIEYDGGLDQILLGGTPWSRSYALMGGEIDFVAVFAGEETTEDDIAAWSLTDMAKALDVASGILDSSMSDSATGVNFTGGTVSISEGVSCASVFVQGDTVLDFTSASSSLSGGKILYVADGASLKIRVSCDGAGLARLAAENGGSINLRLLEGAKYGEVEAESLPECDKFDFSIVQDGGGVSLRVVRDDPDWIDLVTNSGATLESNGGVPYKGLFAPATRSFTAVMDVVVPESVSGADRPLFSVSNDCALTWVLTGENKIAMKNWVGAYGVTVAADPTHSCEIAPGTHRVAIRCVNGSSSVSIDGEEAFAHDGAYVVSAFDAYCAGGSTVDGGAFDGLSIRSLAILDHSSDGPLPSVKIDDESAKYDFPATTVPDPLTGGFTVGESPVVAKNLAVSGASFTVSFAASFPSGRPCTLFSAPIANKNTSINVMYTSEGTLRACYLSSGNYSTVAGTPVYADDKLADVEKPHLYTISYSAGSGTKVYQDGLLIVDSGALKWSGATTTGEIWIGSLTNSTDVATGMSVYSLEMALGAAEVPTDESAEDAILALYDFVDELATLGNGEKSFFASAYAPGEKVILPVVVANGERLGAKNAIDMAIVFGEPRGLEFNVSVASFSVSFEDGAMRLDAEGAIDRQPLEGHSISLAGTSDIGGDWKRIKVNRTDDPEPFVFSMAGSTSSTKGFYKILVERGEQIDGAKVE